MSDCLTVGDLLAWNVAERPDGLAAKVDDDSITWRELSERVEHCRTLLDRERNGDPGFRLAILLPNCIHWVVWCFGAASIGIPVVPLNVKLSPQELAYQIRHSGARLAVVGRVDSLDSKLEQAASIARMQDEDGTSPAWSLQRKIYVEDFAPRPETTRKSLGVAEADLSIAPASADETLFIQYTSGTTALPKGVVLTHRQVLTNAAGVAQKLMIRASDKICSPSPFFHSAGTTLSLFLGLCSGAPVYSFSSFRPGDVLNMIESDGVTLYSGVESFFLGLMMHESFSIERMKTVRAGWIACSSELFDRIEAAIGIDRLVNVYGITEAGPNVTISSVDDPLTARRTCGQPHSGGEIRIADTEGHLLTEAGEVGLIEVRGPSVMCGYFRDPEATRATIDPDGWLHTGDRGAIDIDRNLHYFGREKDMLRVGGENVAASEIEAALLSCPSVTEAAVIAREHPKLVEVPVAFVVIDQGVDATSSQDIVEAVSTKLAPFKVPRSIYLVDSLPKTGSGKIRKHELQLPPE